MSSELASGSHPSHADLDAELPVLSLIRRLSGRTIKVAPPLFRGSGYAARTPVLLVALSSLSSSLLLDAPEIELPNKCFRDDIESVNLLLHQNIANPQRMIREKEIIVRGNEMLPVYAHIENCVRELFICHIGCLSRVNEPLKLLIRNLQIRCSPNRPGSRSPKLMPKNIPKKGKVLDLRKVLHPNFQRSIPRRIRIGKV